MAHIVILGGGFGGLSAAKAAGDIASPIRWIFQRQKNLHVLLAEAERIDAWNRRVVLTDGSHVWFQWLFLHIFKLIGFRNRLSVLLQWAAAYLTFQRSVRLITGSTRSPG